MEFKKISAAEVQAIKAANTKARKLATGSKYLPEGLTDALNGIDVGDGIPFPHGVIKDKDGNDVTIERMRSSINYYVNEAFKDAGKKFNCTRNGNEGVVIYRVADIVVTKTEVVKDVKAIA